MVIDRCYGCMEELTVYPCPRCGYAPASDILHYALRPGKILNGKYLLGKVLGQGGFGITYIGWDLQMERKVAIKEYYPSGYVSRRAGTDAIFWYSSEDAQIAMQDGQSMFLREARKMSRVTGISQVVRIIDVFQENDTSYICMDFIEGCTLKDHLKKVGPLSWEQTKIIFLPIMNAMEQVHKAGLIHRDLSPDNLMLQSDGDVKILDLGAAKDLNLSTGKSSMKVAKSGFSPLEQYVQQGNSGTWTDVYALAATMYYSLTGILPPSAIDRMDRESLDWDLPQLRVLPPAALEAMKRALVIRYPDRTQTMADFSSELMQTNPVKSVTNDPIIYPVQQKKKWWIPIVAVVFLMVSAFVVIRMISGQIPAEIFPFYGDSNRMEQGPDSKTVEQWQGEIDELIAVCDLEVYNYQNGSRMEMYYDAKNRECLRFFVNTQGHDEFVFLAKYNSNDELIEMYGFENQQLMRAVIWTRNEDGKVTESVTQDGSGALLSMTRIFYDSQGREKSRCKLDASGNILLETKSTYDASGAETYSGTELSGDSFVYIYNSDGEIEEYIRRDAQGVLLYHQVIRYDSDGKRTELLSYNPSQLNDGLNEVLSYRIEYKYTGDLQTGEIYQNYSGGTEFSRESEYIYGPRNVLFGRQDLGEYGGIVEDVKAIGEMWRIRSFENHIETLSSTGVTFYNWDGTISSRETYDMDNNLTYKTEYHYSEFGETAGAISISYSNDGSYSVSEMDENLTTLSRKQYTSDGEMIESTVYLYDEAGVRLGQLNTKHEEDGSYTEEEWDESYNMLISRTYDPTGKLISILENQYDSSGKRIGSVSTNYYYDGSYMITEKDSNYNIVSQKTYDAEGNLVKSA